MKRSIVWAIVIGSIIGGISWAITLENETVYHYPQVKAEKIEEKVEPKIEVETLRKELVKICTCESGQGTGKPQQYNILTGEVLRGVKNPKDIGMCQINLFWNGAEAEKMGLDLFKESDNIKFANYLYTKQGAEPWNWSKGCWGK